MIYAQLFSHLELSDDSGKKLSQEQIRSDMVTRLLSYLICHRNNSITVSELAEILWPDDRSENPAGALKNLMYRLRNTLKNSWREENFVITGRGNYRWNPEYPVTVDTEEFERLYKEAKSAQDTEEKTENLLKAVRLYKGRVLPDLADAYWIMSMSVYYHGIYLNAVKELSDLLASTGRFEEMEEICRRAIELDPLEEELHCCLLKAYIGGNKQTLATEHYRETVDLLYDNFGVKPSDELQNIFEEMMKQLHEQESDLSVIQEELKEEKEKPGAFYCEYGVFKRIYELEIRRANRLGIAVYLSLVTLHPETGEKGSSEHRAALNSGMSQMQEVLLSSLRSGDTVTRYSTSQFLVILPGCPYESARMVMDRINYNFYSLKKHAKVRIQYSLDELDLD